MTKVLDGSNVWVLGLKTSALYFPTKIRSISIQLCRVQAGGKSIVVGRRTNYEGIFREIFVEAFRNAVFEEEVQGLSLGYKQSESKEYGQRP